MVHMNCASRCIARHQAAVFRGVTFLPMLILALTLIALVASSSASAVLPLQSQSQMVSVWYFLWFSKKLNLSSVVTCMPIFGKNWFFSRDFYFYSFICRMVSNRKMPVCGTHFPHELNHSHFNNFPCLGVISTCPSLGQYLILFLKSQRVQLMLSKPSKF